MRLKRKNNFPDLSDTDERKIHARPERDMGHAQKIRGAPSRIESHSQYIPARCRRHGGSGRCEYVN